VTLGRELAQKIGINWQSDNPLIFPEVWDVASARILDQEHFPLITTSASSYAWAQGFHPNERVGLEELLIVAGRIAREIKQPLIADLEGCFEHSNQYVKKGVMAALNIGCAGVFIGDGGRDGLHQMLGIMEVANRIKSARLAAIEQRKKLFLVARTDTLTMASILAHPFEETVARANSYLDAGADLVQINGVQNTDVVSQLVERVNGPIAICVSHAGAPNLNDYRDLGVAAISLGTGLMRSALSDMAQKAQVMQLSGQFVHLDDAISDNKLSDLFTGAAKPSTPLAIGS